MDRDYWARLVVQVLVGGSGTAVVGIVVGWLFRRMVRNVLAQLDPRVAAALLAPPPTVPPTIREDTMTGKPNKAIAAGMGVGLILLLEYLASSTQLADVVQHLVGPTLAPAVPVVAGGIVLVIGVWRSEYLPAAAASTLKPPALPVDDGSQLAAAVEPAGTVTTPPVEVTSPPGIVSPPSTGDAAPVTLDPQVEAMLLQVSRVGNDTSIVQLQPAPVRDYR